MRHLNIHLLIGSKFDVIEKSTICKVMQTKSVVINENVFGRKDCCSNDFRTLTNENVADVYNSGNKEDDVRRQINDSGGLKNY